MKTFESRLRGLFQEAEEAILDAVSNKPVKLISEEDINNGEDAFYDLPICQRIDKHGFYEEYAIVEVSKLKERVILKCIGRGEAYPQEADFELSETNDVCWLADLVQKNIK